MEKNITVMGEEVTIKFNMAVQIAYERITGRQFNLDDFKTKEFMPALFMAAIIANNPKTKVKMDYLLSDATVDEVHALDVAISETMSDWLHISDVIPVEKPAEEDEEQPKN